MESMTNIQCIMKQHIDKIMLQLERSISFFRSWCAECHDSDLVSECRNFALAVDINKDVLRIYYRHWTGQFTVPMHHRYMRLMAFDVWAEYRNYMSRYSSPLHQSSDLPF